MFIIVTYDVAEKRVAKIMKICRRYLNHVQNSVFEGMITDGKLESLKKDLKKAVVCEEDSICIYEISNLKYTRRESIGTVRLHTNII